MQAEYLKLRFEIKDDLHTGGDTMLSETITLCAICTVGLVQVVKNILDDGDITTKNGRKLRGWKATLLTIILSLIVTAVHKYLPAVITNWLLVLSTSSIAYDTVYKKIENIGGKNE